MLTGHGQSIWLHQKHQHSAALQLRRHSRPGNRREAARALRSADENGKKRSVIGVTRQRRSASRAPSTRSRVTCARDTAPPTGGGPWIVRSGVLKGGGSARPTRIQGRRREGKREDRRRDHAQLGCGRPWNCTSKTQAKQEVPPAALRRHECAGHRTRELKNRMGECSQ